MSTQPLAIDYITGHCSLGGLLLGACELGFCAILLGDDDESLLQDLQRRFPGASLQANPDRLRADMQQLLAFIERPRQPLELSMPLNAIGTAFQQHVWEELQQVSNGHTISYSDLAGRLGKPKATRAVASACAANPLAIVVPCHRVLRSDGDISGYRWGVARKRELLRREAAFAEQP
ncbi:AraC family transcriptional regulator, regulatory protein of adaptative response / methylated-DNA-[protein]-cysteine methyltransferase [Halopseudomonas sabulinigri]|uniref:AraC family transcriptional regulator, regulatory protein of adaptative response / methylated-DNA-[protein]-cysteine methyltransferase n=1 Tax=Halopseudomonas sabulinigri TaxID=472181 RepID=A0A1H1PIB7_9GAMM|nr:methylated-DNA--[protein]-cysteine S-methyltransferase [Halopseudomonas sabulinigri]SDS10986.1 AraC family transcriptional regulator, regulatory protein of adaptative response / methylated-DNA-[protein]-cysteine methyltransferase [Halopseudomonas sabulinigri]